ncbi:hypothetical protein O5O45_14740 [Hahella aquimaris]|uniref:hypothetical protein n=1 Tax=Hahella sp. HNIBRBA332 TaxID=3015983 RepID=UPI00273AB21B|nr:hypothetical protein [Hahella sp. HNIBRBA332]WLQ17175.1 hypothetical protein O5O45_14740 [Hahella sp. HNIBRBA332]
MSQTASAETSFWSPIAETQKTQEFPYFAVVLKGEELRAYLRAAPQQGTADGLSLTLPMPDQRFVTVEAYDSPVMAPELAEKYPNIRTYKVHGVDIPTLSGRIDYTDAGFKAFLTMDGRSVLIEPESRFSDRKTEDRYRVFFKQDLPYIPKPIEPEGALIPEKAGNSVERHEETVEPGFFSRLWRSIKSWF